MRTPDKKRSWKLPVIILTVIVLFSVMISPLLAGMLAKRSFKQFVRAVNHETSYNMTVISYQQGWLGSDLHFRLEAGKNSITDSLPGAVFKIHLTHGPVIYDEVKKHWTTGLASAHGEISLPAILTALLRGGKTVDQGLLSVNGVIPAQGGFHGLIILPATQISIPAVLSYTWEGLRDQIEITPDHQHPGKFSIKQDMTIGALALSSFPLINTQKFSLKILPGNLIASREYRKDASTENVATTAILTLPGISADFPDISLTVNKLSLSASRLPAGDNLADLLLHFSTGDLAMPRPGIKQFSWDFSFRGVDAAALAKFPQLTARLLRNTPAGTANTMEYINNLVTLITPDTVVQNNINLAADEGNLASSATLLWKKKPDGAVTPLEITRDTEALISLRISGKLLQRLSAEFVSNKLDSEQLALPPEKRLSADGLARAKTQAMTGINQQINDLLGRGYLQQEQQDYVTSITYSDSHLRINGHVVPLQQGSMLSPIPALPVSPAPSPAPTAAPQNISPQPPAIPGTTASQPAVPRGTAIHSLDDPASAPAPTAGT